MDDITDPKSFFTEAFDTLPLWNNHIRPFFLFPERCGELLRGRLGRTGTQQRDREVVRIPTKVGQVDNDCSRTDVRTIGWSYRQTDRGLPSGLARFSKPLTSGDLYEDILNFGLGRGWPGRNYLGTESWK
jgi:hypothetical protein